MDLLKPIGIFLACCMNISLAHAGGPEAPLPTPFIPTSSDWRFEFAPYLWMSGLDGNVTVDGVTNHVNITFGDILNNLQGAAQGHVEIGYQRLSFMIDGTYLRLSENFSAEMNQQAIGTQITTTMGLVDTGLFLRVFGHAPLEIDAASLEVLGGARYFDTTVDLDVDSIGSLTSTNQSLSPIIGGRVKYALSQRAYLWLRGDYGGFHVDGMNSTWSTSLGLAYSIRQCFEIGLAYRALKMDYSRDNLSMDTVIYGPMVGVAFVI